MRYGKRTSEQAVQPIGDIGMATVQDRTNESAARVFDERLRLPNDFRPAAFGLHDQDHTVRSFRTLLEIAVADNRGTIDNG